jgi:hypothetical protein
MNRNRGVVFLVSGIILIASLQCSNSVNPFDNPANVDVHLGVAQNPATGDSLLWAAGDTVTCSVTVEIPHLTDSIAVSVGDDTTIVFLSTGTRPLSDTVFSFTWVFSDSGTHTVSATAYITGTYDSRSDSIDITIGLKPEIDNSGAIGTEGDIGVGKQLTLEISAQGSSPLEYQWLKNGVPLSAETSDALEFESLSIADSAIYSCIVSNTFGADTAESFHLRLVNDTAGPAIRLRSPAHDTVTVHTDSVRIEAIITDTRAVAYVRFSVGVDTFPVTMFDDTIYHATVRGLKQNSTTVITISARDSSGNTTEQTVSCTFIPFTISFTTPPLALDSAVASEDTITVSGTAKSGKSGIESITALVNQKAVDIEGSTSWSLSAPLEPAQWNTISITVTDAQAHDSTCTIYIFRTPPLDSVPSPRASEVGKSTCSLAWDSAPHCTHYRLYRVGPALSDTTRSEILSDTLYQDSGLTECTTYHYLLRGIFTVENKSELTDSTPLSAPLEIKTAASVSFQKTFGGAGKEQGVSLVQLGTNGYILCGNTTSYGAGNSDFYAVRIDRCGDTLWTRTYGGGSDECAQKVLALDNGYFVIAGHTQSYGAGGDDFYLVKIDSSGDTVWTHTYGAGGNERCRSVIQTSDKGFVLCGESTSSTLRAGDVYLVKTDSEGNPQWVKMYGTEDREGAVSVFQTVGSGYIVAGYTYPVQKPSEPILVGGSFKTYLVKLSPGGDTVWTKVLSGTESGTPSDVVQTPDGGFIIGGSTGSLHPAKNVVLIKVDPAGTVLWSKQYGSNEGYQESRGFTIATSGNYVFTGTSDNNVHVWCVNETGGVVWEQSYGGAQLDIGEAIVETGDAGFAIAGQTESFGTGETDIYFIKTDSKGVLKIPELSK